MDHLVVVTERTCLVARRILVEVGRDNFAVIVFTEFYGLAIRVYQSWFEHVLIVVTQLMRASGNRRWPSSATSWWW